MPFNNPAPNFALSCSFNAREWAGISPFDRGSTPITAFPSFSASASSGIYEDAITFLNGRGSIQGISASNSRDLQSQLQTQVGFGSNWTVELTSDDKIRIEVDQPDRFQIALSSGTDFLGVNGTVTAGLVGSRYRVTLDNWTRGNCGASYLITQISTSSSSVWLNADNIVQDCIVYLRKTRNEFDADDTTSTAQPCLERMDCLDEGRWYVDENGHAATCYLTSLGDITWTNTSFRDRLGFNGLEEPAFSGVYSVLTANNPLPCCIYPTRPIEGAYYKVDQVAQSRRKIGGGYVSNFVGSYLQTVLTYHVDGLLDTTDLTRHFTDEFLTYATNGSRVNYYQGVGDSRRSKSTVEGGGVDYTKLYTTEDNGYQGRIRGNLISTNNYALQYPSRLRRRIRIEQTLEHLNE